MIAKLYEIKTLMTLFNLYAKPKTVGKLKRKKDVEVFDGLLLPIFKRKRNDGIDHRHDENSFGCFVAITVDVNSK